MVSYIFRYTCILFSVPDYNRYERIVTTCLCRWLLYHLKNGKFIFDLFDLLLFPLRHILDQGLPSTLSELFSLINVLFMFSLRPASANSKMKLQCIVLRFILKVEWCKTYLAAHICRLLYFQLSSTIYSLSLIHI